MRSKLVVDYLYPQVTDGWAAIMLNKENEYKWKYSSCNLIQKMLLSHKRIQLFFKHMYGQGKLIIQRMKWQTSLVKNELERAQKNLYWQLTWMIYLSKFKHFILLVPGRIKVRVKRIHCCRSLDTVQSKWMSDVDMTFWSFRH